MSAAAFPCQAHKPLTEQYNRPFVGKKATIQTLEGATPESAAANDQRRLLDGEQVYPAQRQARQHDERGGIKNHAYDGRDQHDDHIVDFEVGCIFPQARHRLYTGQVAVGVLTLPPVTEKLATRAEAAAAEAAW